MKNIARKILLITVLPLLGASPYYAKNPFKKVTRMINKKVVKPAQKVASGKEVLKQIRETRKDIAKVKDRYKEMAAEAKNTVKHAKNFDKNQKKAFGKMGDMFAEAAEGDFKDAGRMGKEYARHQKKAGNDLYRTGKSAYGTYTGVDNILYASINVGGGVLTGHNKFAQPILTDTIWTANKCVLGKTKLACLKAGDKLRSSVKNFVFNGNPLGKKYRDNKYAKATFNLVFGQGLGIVGEAKDEIMRFGAKFVKQPATSGPSILTASGKGQYGSVHGSGTLIGDDKTGEVLKRMDSAGISKYSPAASRGSLLNDDRTGDVLNRLGRKKVIGVVRIAKAGNVAGMKEAKLAELRAMER